MLKQRVITAIILALVTLGVVLGLDSFYVSILLAFVLFFSMLELVNMTISKRLYLQSLIGLLVVGLFLLAVPSMDIRLQFLHSYTGLVLWLSILLFMLSYHFSGQWTLPVKLAVALLSTALLWISIHGLYFIHSHFVQGGWLMLYVLTLVWVADIGAYFSGRRFGRHKLAPGISPGKTREGVLGGLVLNCAWITLVYTLSSGWGMDYLPFLFLGLVTSAISVVGDLYESILKREAGVKDSGKVLPGHGGVLDRIDSVIAATPVYVTGLFILGAV